MGALSAAKDCRGARRVAHSDEAAKARPSEQHIVYWEELSWRGRRY